MGWIVIEDNGTAVTAIRFTDEENRETKKNIMAGPAALAAAQLEEYFAGKRKAFDLPLEPGGTEFQKKVWSALQEIPYGKMCTYGELAVKIGNPRASRAVGGANNKNPIAIVIPCHRVIGADGTLVGYAAGLQIKEKLLRFEGGLL